MRHLLLDDDDLLVTVRSVSSLQTGPLSLPRVRRAARRVTRRERIGAVLSGGGSRGAIQIGMLAALIDAGIEFDVFVGSSIGALNAASFAADPTPGRLAHTVQRWREITTDDVFGAARRRYAAAALLRGYDHLCDRQPLVDLVRNWVPVEDLAELDVPVHVVTTDLAHGTAQVWDHGPAHDILLASMALPGVFPPVELDGRLHVDGGVVCPVPVRTGADLAVDRLYVLDVAAAGGFTQRDKMRAVDVLSAAFTMSRRALATTVEPPDRRLKIIDVPCPDPGVLSVYDMSRSSGLVELGRAATMRWLAEDPDLRLPRRHRDRS